MEYQNYSAIVVGSGLAGLYTALKLSEIVPENGKILLLTKSELGESNSRYAQGGIVAVLSENTEDSVASHISDTINAGAGLCDFNTVKYISETSNAAIKDLINYGVKFDCDEQGNLLFTLEGAHSVKRILHCNGDATGRGIESHLSMLVSENQKIKIQENSIAVELLLDEESSCKGLIVFDGKNYSIALSNCTILATGGIGQLYRNTTNPKCATGDGLSLAYNAGAILQDMEFVQFHPTALAVQSENANFLISEAVRGEGAKLVDDKGNPFMQKYHELKDLAPRDIVTRANFAQMEKSGEDCVYLDATKISPEKLQMRFPNISNVCLKNGIDISKNYIPVHPAAHYFMGGIKANIDGRTSVNGLFALGEVSSTGLHGANRLASNSLLECVVMGYSLAKYLTGMNFEAVEMSENFEKALKKYSQQLGFIEYDTDLLKSELQDIMWQYVGILRDENGLKTANAELQKLKLKFLRNEKCLNIQEYEFKNMLTVAQLIINSALNRKESRGAHYRTDFMITKDIAEHNCIMKQQGELSFVR